MISIRRVNPSEAGLLTQIALQAKRHWGYPDHWIELWKPQLTFDAEYFNLGHLDSLSYRDTFVHRLDPRVKLIATVGFIIVVVSFSKHEITGLFPFFLFPVLLFALGDIPVSFIMKKVFLVSSFAFCSMAEGVGFEHTGRFRPAVFKTAAFSRSAIPPRNIYIYQRSSPEGRKKGRRSKPGGRSV